MSAKLTPWFDGRVKPVRVGVYQRDYSDEFTPHCVVYCRWDGRIWHCYSDTPEFAAFVDCESGGQTHNRWRGLAVKP